MHETEIFVAHPVKNPNPVCLRRWSQFSAAQKMHDRILADGVSPQSHQYVADLCSGDGVMAETLVSLGWDLRDIFCIDKHISPTPLVPDARWIYANLAHLADAITGGHDLPPMFLSMRHAFGIVISAMSIEIPIEKIKTVHAFLLAPDGHEYHY